MYVDCRIEPDRCLTAESERVNDEDEVLRVGINIKNRRDCPVQVIIEVPSKLSVGDG